MRVRHTILAQRAADLSWDPASLSAELKRRGVKYCAYSTVAGWLNGNRGFKEMRSLEELCDILQLQIDAVRINAKAEPADALAKLHANASRLDAKDVNLLLQISESMLPKPPA